MSADYRSKFHHIVQTYRDHKDCRESRVCQEKRALLDQREREEQWV